MKELGREEKEEREKEERKERESERGGQREGGEDELKKRNSEIKQDKLDNIKTLHTKTRVIIHKHTRLLPSQKYIIIIQK